MVGERVGYSWAAQKAFDACSGGLSISDFFLHPQDKCCGIAPNPPITGPGTIIVFTVGTFVNLLITLSWKSEGPYNLLAQVLATDGAFFGLLARCIESHNRLSEFHAAFVPLAVMSCLPIAIAALSVESWYLHNVSLPAYISLVVTQFNHTSRPEGQRSKSAPGKVSLERLSSEQRHVQHEDFKKMHKALLDDPIAKKRSWLTPLIRIIFLGHVGAWIGLFSYVLSGYPDPAQPLCSEELDFRRYRIMIAAMCSLLVLITCLFLLPLFLAFSKGWRAKHKDIPPDVLQFWGRIFHFAESVEPAIAGYKLSREIIRYSFSFLMFFVFVACYLTVYVKALNEFVLMGDTPFDYGQLAACANILVPVCVTARTWLDQRDSYKTGFRSLQERAITGLGKNVIENEETRDDIVAAAKAEKGKKGKKAKKAKKDKSGKIGNLFRPFRKADSPPPEIPLKPIPPARRLSVNVPSDLNRAPSLFNADTWAPADHNDDTGRVETVAGSHHGSRRGSRRGDSPARSISGRSGSLVRLRSRGGGGGRDVDLDPESSGTEAFMSGALGGRRSTHETREEGRGGRREGEEGESSGSRR